MAEEEERRWAKPASGRSTVLTLTIVLLLGLVGWLLAERNARQWSLVYEEGTLSVKKGILFPVGRQAFKTDDPLLAQAYAPLKPPPGVKLDDERSFEDRAGLDQALYELLAKWARDDLATEKPDMVERALSWLARADKLAGLSNTRGWGTFLIKSLVDEVEFSSTSRGNVVRMVIYLEP